MRIDMAEQSIRLVGQAWEVRHYLRKATAAHPRDTTVADWLAQRGGQVAKSPQRSGQAAAKSPQRSDLKLVSRRQPPSE